MPVGYLGAEKLFQMPLELPDLLVIEVMGSLSVLAGYGKDVMKRCLDIIMPQVEETAGAITGRTGNHAVQEAILSPDAHLQATPGEGAVVNVKVGVAVFKLHLLGVTGNPNGKSSGRMDDFLRDIGAEPAKHLLPPAFVL